MKDEIVKKFLTKTLREVADKIEEGSCKISSEQAEKYLEIVSIQPISKDEACSLLGISRATFDNYVRTGVFPRGEKQRGFKELSWDKGELLRISNELKNK